MKTLYNKIKKMINIIKNYDNDIKNAHDRISTLEQIIKNRTDIAADINYRGNNYIITIGRYRGVEYIQTFTVPADELMYTITKLRDMSRYGNVRCIDAPPDMRCVIDMELNR